MRRIVWIFVAAILLSACSAGPDGKAKPERTGMFWKEKPPVQTMMVRGVRP